MAARMNNNPEAFTTVGDAGGNDSFLEMQKYFGPMSRADIETHAADKFAHTTHNLPRSYVGRNLFLQSTIDFLLTKTDDWYTRVMLPWFETDELHVEWQVWRFNKTIFELEPHQGVPRYVTQESEQHSDTIVRRGLAFIIEHGFWKSELGKQHYFMNIKQIVDAIHTTAYLGVMHALLGCYSERKLWQLRHGSLAPQTLSDVMADERRNWALCQKDIKGLYVMDAELRDRLKRQGVEATAYVWPSKMSIYASMVPQYNTEFLRAGEQAMSASGALEQGDKRFASFRGLPVYETEAFDVDFLGENGIDPLKRPRQIGQYSVYNPVSKAYRDDVHMFDMNLDRFTHVAMSDALEHSLRFNYDGEAAENQLDGPRELDCSAFSKANSDCWAYHEQCHDVFYTGDGDDGRPDEQDAMRYNEAGNVSAFGTPFQIRHMCGWMRPKDGHPGGLTQQKRDYVNTLFQSVKSGAAPPGPPDINVLADMYISEYALQAAETAWQKLPTSEVKSACKVTGSMYRRKRGNNGNGVGFDGLLSKSGVPGVAPAYNKADFIANYLTTPVTYSNFLSMLEHDIALPVSIVLARPFCTYQMGTAILARGGLELGMTAHGHHDFQLADDVIHKVHVGHYTFYSRSIVKDSKLLAFADNVFACGYHGGENTEFASNDDINAYLTESEVRKTHGSIIPQVAAVPFRGLQVKPVIANNSHRDRVTLDIPNPICLHGQIPGAYLGAGISPHAATLWTSKGFLMQVHREMEERMINADDGVEPFVGSATTISHLNSMCFQEQQQDGSGNVTIQGTGHWGTHCYDGCGAARTGAYSELMQAREGHGVSLTYN